MDILKRQLIASVALASAAIGEVGPVVGFGWGGPKGLVHAGMSLGNISIVGSIDEVLPGSDRYDIISPAVAVGWKTPCEGIELWGTTSVQYLDISGDGVSLTRDAHIGTGPSMKDGWNAGLLSLSVARRFGDAFGVTPSLGYGVFLDGPSSGMIRVGVDFDWRGKGR